MSQPYGPDALRRLREDEEVEIAAQRWQFDILLRGASERLRDLIRQRNNAVHPVEASQINQIIDCYEAILSDFGNALGYVVDTVSLTQEAGIQRYPLTFDMDELEEQRAERRDKATDVTSEGIKTPPPSSYPDDRRTEERRTETDLTREGEEKRSGQDRREPATV